jgi:hypothetical protein
VRGGRGWELAAWLGGLGPKLLEMGRGGEAGWKAGRLWRGGLGGAPPGFGRPKAMRGRVGRLARDSHVQATGVLLAGGVFTSVRNVAAAEAQRAEGGPNLYFWYLVACGVAYASGVGPFLCSPNRKGGIAWRSALALFVISLPLEGSVVLSILALETIEASDMAIIMSLNLVLTLAVRAWVRRWVPPPTLAAVACGVCATVAAWTLRDGNGASAALRPGHGVACLALAMRAASAVALERALDPARGVAWCNHYSALARVAGGGAAYAVATALLPGRAWVGPWHWAIAPFVACAAARMFMFSLNMARSKLAYEALSYATTLLASALLEEGAGIRSLTSLGWALAATMCLWNAAYVTSLSPSSLSPPPSSLSTPPSSLSTLPSSLSTSPPSSSCGSGSV